jgi:hypothetical protein
MMMVDLSQGNISLAEVKEDLIYPGFSLKVSITSYAKPSSNSMHRL